LDHHREQAAAPRSDPKQPLPGSGAAAKAKPDRLGIAADHGGFGLKQYLLGRLRAAGHNVKDFGDRKRRPKDDYPDFVVPLARAVACGQIHRGVAICGSGVGVSVAANKVAALEGDSSREAP
jgi:hypothetical protein